MSEVKTLVTLVLGGVFNHKELGDIDIVYEAPACEALQRELVTDSDDVHVELVSRIDYDTALSQLAALREELATLKSAPMKSPLYEAWIDSNDDLLGRLLVGKATEGDQLLAHNHIHDCDIYEDIYGQLCELIEPYVSRPTNPDGALPASVVEGFGIVFREWVDLQQRLADAEQRNASNLELLREIQTGYRTVLSSYMEGKIQAALNPNPEAASHD